jgi:hypothetical protein
MNVDRDPTGRLDLWIKEDVPPPSERVVDGVLEQISVTRQRRAFGPAGGSRPMSTTIRFALVAAVVAVVAVTGLNLLQMGGRLGGPAPSPAMPTGASPSTATSTPPASHALLASPTPRSVPEGSLPKLDLPGTRSSPAGEYGWEGGPGQRSGMHRVIEDGTGSREATAMVFGVGSDCLNGSRAPKVQVRSSALHGEYVEPFSPPVSFGVTSPGMVTRAYAFDVGDRRLCVYLTWNSATTPAELGAAETVVRTLRAEAIAETRIRVVFTLEDGWDIG